MQGLITIWFYIIQVFKKIFNKNLLL
jgi:hypothetical protein